MSKDIIVPARGRLVFGVTWGGWTWLSVSPHGEIIRWLQYWRKGENDMVLVYFKKETNFEQYCDAIDANFQASQQDS